VIVTDKLKSYAAAKRQILPGVEHRQSRYLNNRAEVSHQPTRRRERQMQRFKSPRQAKRFYPPTAGSITTFSSAAIVLPPTNIVPLVTPHSARGVM
jgi:putative transposase